MISRRVRTRSIVLYVHREAVMARARGEGKTPHRQVRVEDEHWERFGEVATALGTDRSAWIRDAIRWCLREPGVKAPRRQEEGNIS
jgi:hypothetical protein